MPNCGSADQGRAVLLPPGRVTRGTVVRLQPVGVGFDLQGRPHLEAGGRGPAPRVLGQGFRAPSIGELFGGASRFDQVVADPCSDFLGLSGGAPANATVRANCIARGVPANGSYVQLNAQLPVVTSGNTSLVPRPARAGTSAACGSPSSCAMRAGRAALDRAGLFPDQAGRRHQRAQRPDPAAALRQHQRRPLLRHHLADGVRRDLGHRQPADNIGGIRTKSLDLNVTWTSPDWSFGRFGVHSYTTRLLKFTELLPTSDGLAPTKRLGTERGSPDQAYPKWKSNTSIDWDRGDFGATGTFATSRACRRPAIPTSSAAGPTSTPSFAGSRLCRRLRRGRGDQQPVRQGTRRLHHLQSQQLRPQRL